MYLFHIATWLKRITLLHADLFWRNIIISLNFLYCLHSDGLGSWNPSSWKARTLLNSVLPCDTIWWCRILAQAMACFLMAPSHYLNQWWLLSSPCGCGDLSVRLGSRISPHRHWVMVEVHWCGAQGWRSISWVVATFNHVGGSFNLSMAATGDVWIIPSFRIWGYVLHVEHISCVITNCGQLQWAIPSLFSIAL